MSTLDAATVKHLLRKGVQIPEDILASIDGLPRELLHDAMREHHHRKDTLSGYRPLDTWFLAHPESPDDKRQSMTWHPWNPMFKESGLEGKYTHTLLVADLWMRKARENLSWFPLGDHEKDRYPGEHRKAQRAQRQARIRVYLTRKQEFIVWASWPVCKFVEQLGMDSAVKTILELTPEKAKLVERYDRGTGKTDEEIEVVHPALTLVRGIAVAMESSFLKKRREAAIEEYAYMSLRRYSGIYFPSVPV